MIKALRLSSIVVAALAVYFFAFPVVFGTGQNTKVEEFLQQPTAIEKFKKEDRDKSRRPEHQDSPLVREAARFANYLNPPKPPPPKRGPSDDRSEPPADNRPPPPPPPPGAVMPRITLIALSYNESRPEDSVALIDEPGEGRHWVRQSQEVSGMAVEIKDGLVVAKGSGKQYEFTVRHQPQRSLLMGASSFEPSSKSLEAGNSGSVSIGDTGFPAAKESSRGPSSAVPSSPRESLEERRQNIREIENVLSNLDRRDGSGRSKGSKAEQILARLRSMREGRSNEVDSGDSSGSEKAASGKISGRNNYRISGSEAEKLGSLGKELDDSESIKGRTERLKERRRRSRERAEQVRERIREMMEKRRSSNSAR